MMAGATDDSDHIEGYSVAALFESFGRPETALDDDEIGEWSGRSLGPYDLIGEIARGGMGIVFRARHRELGREVAIKVLRSGSFAVEEELTRFRSEARVLAQLDHPNIVPLYEIGEDEGQPYLVMKLIEGGSLLEHEERFRTDGKAAAEVMKLAGGAVAEAHGHGVLHRDLKPSNILLDESGAPHLTDFGLSRRLGIESSLTISGAVLGSPHYLAPEVAEGNQDGATTASDVYGLGAVLYHLLTGRPPVEGDAPLAVLKAVSDGDLTKPSLLNPALNRDLETICLKCLHRDATRRYSSAHDLVADLERWQNGEPISARPATAAERWRHWMRRHPVRAVIITFVLLGLLGGVVLEIRNRSSLQASRDVAIGERERAQEAEREMRKSYIRLQLERADQEIESGQHRRGLARLLSVLERAPGHPIAEKRLWHEWSNRRFALEKGRPLQHPRGIRNLGVSNNGTRVVTVDLTGAVRVWDMETREQIGEPLIISEPCRRVGINADASRVLVLTAGRVTLWNPGESEAALEWTEPDGLALNAELHPDEDKFFVVMRSSVVVRETSTGRELARLSHEAGNRIPVMRVDPSGGLLVVSQEDGMHWWDARSHEYLAFSPSDPPGRFCFSGDGKRLLVSSRSGELQMWDASRREPLGEPQETEGVVRMLILDGTGEKIAMSRASSHLGLRSAAEIDVVLDSIPVKGILSDADFSSRNDLLVTGSSDGAVRFWDLRSPVRAGGSTMDGLRMVWTDADGRRRLQSGRTGRAELVDEGGAKLLAVSEPVMDLDGNFDGSLFAVATLGRGLGRMHLVDGESLEIRRTIAAKRGRMFGTFSPSGSLLAVTHVQQGLMIWDCQADKRRFLTAEVPRTTSAAFGPDESWLATAGPGGVVRRWSAETGEPLGEWFRHGGGERLVGALAVSPDGSYVVSGGFDQWVRWWSAEGGEAALLGEAELGGVVAAVAVSPDGKWILGAADNGEVGVWDRNGGQLVCQFFEPDSPLIHARFVADGKHVLTASRQGRARIRRIPSGLPVTGPLSLADPWSIPEVPETQGSSWLAEVAAACGLTPPKQSGASKQTE